MTREELASFKRRCAKSPGDERDYAIPVAEVRDLIGEIDRLHVVLSVISAWDLPRQTIEVRDVNGGVQVEDCSFEYAWGSHGAREYIRKLAADAIDGK